MKRFCLWLGLAVLPGVAVGPAGADGMILGPSFLWRGIKETTQTAFIEVRRDHSVLVDLYIGLQDESGKGRPVIFALPFFSAPRAFSATEVQQGQITQRAATADRLLREYWSGRQRIRTASDRLTPGLSLLCTPASPLIYALSSRQRGLMRTAVEGGTYTTEHSRIVILQTSVKEDLRSLVKRYGLPEEAASAIARYLGKPVAIIKIRPLPPGAARSWSPQVSETAPLLRLRFAQDMQRAAGGWRYAYPLGTGAAWAAPISGTVIYILSNSRRNIKTTFPGEDAFSGYEGKRAGGLPRVARAADGNLQVQWAEYPPHNQADDVWVTLRNSGTSSLASHTRMVKLGYPLLCTMTFLLAVISWTGGFALSWRLLPWPRIGFLRACGLGWLVGVPLPALALSITVAPVLAEGPVRLAASLFEDLAQSESAPLAVILAFCAAVTLFALRAIRPAGGSWRVAAALTLLGAAAALSAALVLATLLSTDTRRTVNPLLAGAFIYSVAVAVAGGAIWGIVQIVRGMSDENGQGRLYARSVFAAALASTVFYLTGAALMTVFSRYLLAA